MILCKHAAGRFSIQEFDPPGLVDRTLPSRLKQLSVSGKKYPKIPAVDCDEQGFLAIYFVIPVFRYFLPGANIFCISYLCVDDF